MTEQTKLAYGFGIHVNLPYTEAVERTKAALKEQGFGVLTEIDVKATMKQKLNADFRPYIILGACNPPLAHRALTTELDIGLLLPCNVVVYETEGGSVVEVMDPAAAMGVVGNAALEPIAREAKTRLAKALDALAS
ncbi:MAG: DUF302 domain-containing protein [Anaerolineae bacterium]